jgi:hypothetical protein
MVCNIIVDIALKADAEQLVAGERGIASFSTSLVWRGLRVAARAT